MTPAVQLIMETPSSGSSKDDTSMKSSSSPSSSETAAAVISNASSWSYSSWINSHMKEEGVYVHGHITPEYATILTPDALRFLKVLHLHFNNRRIELLKNRRLRQVDIDGGILPDFLPTTEFIRADESWKGPPLAPGLVDRKIEITGPVDRKMTINGLNAGANCFMADFEDSSSPTWDNMINGQINMRDAIHRTITYVNGNGKLYLLKGQPATLLVRPRGLHLLEKHVTINGEPICGSLFDFGLYFYHNAEKSIAVGQGPYFYIPKLESHLEARWWNDVFNMAQEQRHISRGTIRATVLIETLLGAFEMDEILYELREHSAGLNCGRWDYIFSTIKLLRNHPQFVLPDREKVSMNTKFMDAYVQLVIKTCHRRGVHAIGGMAAQIPIRNNEAANAAAFLKVKNDKLNEVMKGHDGTWVAHPGLIPVAYDAFNAQMTTAHQISRLNEDISISAADLLPTNCIGSVTLAGVRINITVALEYMESWLRGVGCIPIQNLMEDAATAEISRSQLWQWIKYAMVTTEGVTVTRDLFSSILDEEISKISECLGEARMALSKFPLAGERLRTIVTDEHFHEFLTLNCYDDIY